MGPPRRDATLPPVLGGSEWVRRSCLPKSTWDRGWRAKILLILSLILLAGCAPEATPDLIEVERLEPTSVEAGTELRITGLGFAERQAGTLRLIGTLFAPGRSPRAVDWSVSISPETRALVTLRVQERHLDEWLGAVRHATFHGKAQLQFAPRLPGRPTLRGEHEGVTLNLFTSRAASEPDAQAFTRYLGLELSTGLVVQAAAPGRPAALADVRVGDRLVALDGVDLDKHSDFVPAPHLRQSTLKLVRPGEAHAQELSLDRGDFQLLDGGLLRQVLACGLGLGLALLLAARPPRSLLWMAGPRPLARAPFIEWLEGVGARLQPLSYVIFAGISVGYFWMMQLPATTLGAFDFLLVLAAGILAILISAWLLGGVSEHGRFSLIGALASTTTSFLLMAPVFIAALGRAAEVGSLSLSEIDRAQGALPPHVGALASPWSLLSSVAYLVALLPLSGRRPPVFGKRSVCAQAGGARGRALVVARALEWSGWLLLLSLWCSLYGGAILHGMEGSLVLCASVYCTKLAMLGYGLTAIRNRTGHLRAGEAWTLWGLRNLLLSLGAAGCLLLSWRTPTNYLTLEVKSAFCTTLSVTFILLLTVAQTRSWWHRGRSSDPWI